MNATHILIKNVWHFVMKESLKLRVTNAASLPKDVVLKVPILTVIGQMELRVENYRGITEYTDSFIRIQTKIGQIKIHGEHLEIPCYTNDEMQITGSIHQIEYG